MTREQLLQRRGLATVAVLALLAAAGLPTAASGQSAVERARVAVYAGGVDLVPEVAYQRAILTVAGNGETYRYELAPGEPLSIGLFDPDGGLLADGAYGWELELVPDKLTAAKLRAEAIQNGGRPLEPWSAQSGSFTIRGGAIDDPAFAEGGPARRAASSAATRPDTAASFGAGRRAPDDGDAVVGSRAEAEAQANAAAARSAPAASGGALLQPDRAAGDDADATSAALGRSLEATAAANQLSSQSRGALAPRPRSDGSNGRPRSQ